MLLNADAIHIPLKNGTVQTCVTSPPYYGLRDYQTATWAGGDPGCDHQAAKLAQRRFDYPTSEKQLSNAGSDPQHYADVCTCGAVRVDLQIGLEESPEAYVEKLVQVCREIWRVMRDDGTLWLNLGDSYATNPGNGRGGESVEGRKPHRSGIDKTKIGLKTKDLCMIPARVAMALQADGWYLRSDIIWAKKNPMPESVTDRPTKSHEYLFLLSKSQKYYYDADAIAEPSKYPDDDRKSRSAHDQKRMPTDKIAGVRPGSETYPTRNKRSVWTVATKPYPGSHFATFPPALIEPCILAGTSEKGQCPECGAPWVRVVEKSKTFESGSGRSGNAISGKQDLSASETNSTPDIRMGPVVKVETVGWEPSCECNAGEPVPQIVLDPFGGSGTTGEVAARHRRRYVLLDLSMEYIELQKKRTVTDVRLF